jgi:hypothetical protein
MSLNPAVRIETVEVKMNPEELASLDGLRKLFGLGRSPFLRALSNVAAHTHGMAPPPVRESRGCPGRGRPACRARGAMGGARRNL